MSLLMPERLYQLLPAFIRNRDMDQGQPLRALLGVVEGELELVEKNISVLYDNWFIETCEEWVVPYIGDLLGVRPINPIASAGVSARAYVANTIAYRRRKGTAVVLEQLARDVTGWPAHAAEFFTRLVTAQHVNHIRIAPPATPSVRDAAVGQLADGPFDAFAHTLEVRNPAIRHGRFNIPNVGIYLWRLRSYAVGAGNPGDESPDFASARNRGAWWSIHPVGCDSPLFNVPRTQTTITHLSQEQNVPGELRSLALNAELQHIRRRDSVPAPVFMPGQDPVLRVFARLTGETLPVEVRREDMYVCEIPGDVALASPTPRAMALDPQRGRLEFPASLDVSEVWTQSSYGFSGDLGGGPYDRSSAVRAANLSVSIDVSPAGDAGGFFDPGVWQVGVSHLLPDDGTGTVFPSLSGATAAWNALPAGRTGVIVLMDSLSDVFSSAGGPLEIRIGASSHLLIVAGEWPLEPVPGAPPGSERRVPGHIDAQQIRAHFVGDLSIRGTAAADSADAGACHVNGLIIEGRLTVAPGNLGRLGLAHCTVVPGRGTLVVDSGGGNERLGVSVDQSICAAINISAPIRALEISDSIIGENTSSPDFSVDTPQTALSLLRSSFFGAVNAFSLSASDCIFADHVEAQRRQTGCIRFSYVPPGSRVPRRYRCQPDLEIATRIEALSRTVAPATPTPAQQASIAAEVDASIRPLFVSRLYGDPGFGQLELRCAAQILTGAESGAEMGAFEFLKQPQRAANLRTALDEYLRFGLAAALIYVT